MAAKITLGFILLFVQILANGATISTNKASYGPGEIITVTFGGATAKTDWVGMYNSTIVPGVQNSLGWLYLNGSQATPDNIVESGTLSFTAPSDGGNYKMCFHPNDGYTVAATAEFTVALTGLTPSAAFTSSSLLVTPGAKVTFNDQSLNTPTSWSWSFPGGNPSESSVQHPVIQYDLAGTYSVSLKATNEFGNNELTKTSYITVSPISDSTTTVRLMHLNIWLDGTVVENGLAKIRDVVAAVNPDIACFVEVGNYTGDWTTKLVNELAGIGHHYYAGYVNGSDASIISKYPITSKGPLLRSTVSMFNVDVNGTTIVVAASHLDYTYYACYLPRGYRCGGSPPYNGWTQIGSHDPQPVTDISIIAAQNLGSQRDEQIGAFLDYVAQESRPIILMGDFNEPSHQDWTEGQANLFDHNGVVFQWTTTHSLTDQGFTDAYRKVFPDEVLNPGITWPSFATGEGNTSWTPKSDDRDRIDFIFYRGNKVEVTDAAIIGPKASYAKSILTTDYTENDPFLADSLAWPSDHKGVFATIAIPSASDTITSARIPAQGMSDIKVFPNPGFGIFNLLAGQNTSAHISISNPAGVEVFTKEVQMVANELNTCDISDLTAGAYFIRISTEVGTQTLKIIKK